MVKLSELKDDVILINELDTIRYVEEIKANPEWFKDEKLYTTTEYHAHIDARSVLEEAFNSEYEHRMYEDWDERIKDDIKDEDVEKIQAVFDDILSRNKEQNIAYYQDEEVEVDIVFERMDKPNA